MKINCKPLMNNSPATASKSRGRCSALTTRIVNLSTTHQTARLTISYIDSPATDGIPVATAPSETFLRASTPPGPPWGLKHPKHITQQQPFFFVETLAFLLASLVGGLVGGLAGAVVSTAAGAVCAGSNPVMAGAAAGIGG